MVDEYLQKDEQGSGSVHSDLSFYLIPKAKPEPEQKTPTKTQSEPEKTK